MTLPISWDPKAPSEVASYRVLWATELGSDTIATSTWEVPTGITKDSDSFTSNTATIILSGGTSPVTYTLKNTIVTTGGDTFVQYVTITVRIPEPSLVDLRMVKRRLHIEEDNHDDDDDLEGLIIQASRMVIGYLKSAADVFLDDDGAILIDSVQPEVQAATIRLVGYLYKNPDGDPDKEFSLGNLPWSVTALVYHLRDPAMA
jgi:hypothetical protein